jgi:TolB-like protein
MKRAFVGAAGLLAAAAIVWLVFPRGELSSVAVLPLENASADPGESDDLAEGITQSVITRLSQVGLRVTPWETARQYVGRKVQPQLVARELNVDAVLVGTFQLSGDRILTRLTLVEEKSGFIAWSEEFEEPYEDLFQVQRRIAHGAASSLKRSLSGEEERVLGAPESKSVDAYDLYLQGSYLMQEGGAESTAVAFDYFTRALELDPSLAIAHVGLGAVYQSRYQYGWGGASSLDSAVSSFERALELNPGSMRARRGLSVVHWWAGRSKATLAQGDFARRDGGEDEVETLLTRAVAYSWGGLPQHSLPLYRRVIELDPANPEAYWHLVIGGTYAERPEDVVEAGERYLQLFGDDPGVHAHMGVGYQILHDAERAGVHHAKATEGLAEPYMLLWAGMFFDGQGDEERAEGLWMRGVAITRATVDTYPDHAGMRAFLACFYGLLGESDRFREQSNLTLETGTYNEWSFPFLALVEAKLGDGVRAAEILRRTVRHGRLDQLWKVFFSISSVTLPDSEPFRQFLTEYEALERELTAAESARRP